MCLVLMFFPSRNIVQTGVWKVKNLKKTNILYLWKEIMLVKNFMQ